MDVKVVICSNSQALKTKFNIALWDLVTANYTVFDIFGGSVEEQYFKLKIAT